MGITRAFPVAALLAALGSPVGCIPPHVTAPPHTQGTALSIVNDDTGAICSLILDPPRRDRAPVVLITRDAPMEPSARRTFAIPGGVWNARLIFCEMRGVVERRHVILWDAQTLCASTLDVAQAREGRAGGRGGAECRAEQGAFGEGTAIVGNADRAAREF